MIKAVLEKYCKDNLVQLMPYTDHCQLIISADEILFLKIGNRILVNKYENHPSRYLFPYSDNIKYTEGFETRYNQLFEYHKIYLNFRGSVSGYRFDKSYFFKGTNRALYFSEVLEVDDRKTKDNVEYLTRNEVEKVFDCMQYDSMYVIDRNGTILFAKSRKDGSLITKKIIPSDKEIIEMEQQKRKSDLSLAKIFNESIVTAEKIKEVNTKQAIENIHEFQLYGPILFRNYSHFLVTSLNGKFEMKWFKLDFVSNNKFRLTTSNIQVMEPTVNDVIAYSNHNKIENTDEPILPETDETIEKAISKIPKELPCRIVLEEDINHTAGLVKKVLKKIKRKEN